MFKIDAVPAIEKSNYRSYMESEETCWDEKGKTEISQIFVSASQSDICSIQFQYIQNDSYILSPQYGSSYGPKFYPVRFNYPSEFLTRVSGKYLHDGVKSIMFTTNRRTHGPYGCNEQKDAADFDFCLGDNNQFGGFHGSYTSWGLRSIGVYFNPSITTTATSTEVSSGTKSATLIRRL